MMRGYYCTPVKTGDETKQRRKLNYVFVTPWCVVVLFLRSRCLREFDIPREYGIPEPNTLVSITSAHRMKIMGNDRL